MRKIMINQSVSTFLPVDLQFLDLEQLAQVEFTSESQEHPVETALMQKEDLAFGWQAACSGEQIVRLIFDQPQTIEHILLVFDELQQSRTQEFVILWLMDKATSYQEILRQQYHFSPPNTVREIEHYQVKLNQLKALELRITPDIDGGDACAKLKLLRLA